VNKKILKLAIPNILSNLSVPLLSSVDTAVMGHLTSPVYLGAIALGSMIFNFIYWGFGFLRMGTTGLTAQAFGGKNNPEISSILFRSLFISLTIGILLIAFQYPISSLSFYLVNGSADVENLALKYFDIRIFAAPATLSLYALHGWFLGVQNSRFPLYISLFVNVFNIILNLTFVYLFNMNVDGVAWGTLISQYLGVFLSVFLLIKYYKNFFGKFHLDTLINKEKIKKFFQINTDIFLRTLLLIFTISFFTAKSAEYNNDILAANFILLQLWLIISYGVDGFAFAAESLVGKFVGAKDKSNLKKVIKNSFAWGIGIGIVLSLVYFIFSREILSLYTNQSKVIEIALGFMIWIVVAPVINSISFIWDGIYIGATATREMLFSMIVSTLIFFLPIYFLTKDVLGNHSIWLALTIFMVVRGLTLTFFAKRFV